MTSVAGIVVTEPLNRAQLRLPPGITGPSFDVTKVTPGIVHIGLGGFHRAHFARYTHDLMEIDSAARHWGIVGAGLRVSDRPLLRALATQDGLYTLVERDLNGEKRTIIGSVVRTIDASNGSELLLKAMAAHSTHIVSVTVSENGYHLDGSTRSLNCLDPAIVHDMFAPRRPVSMPGILVEAFRLRREAKQSAFTALSCDNIQHNGNVLRLAVVTLAHQTDSDLALWIEEHAGFPNSMVDRITPIPTQKQIADFQLSSGLADQAPIFSEAFKQWVIEDSFVDGRPDWDHVGAQFVRDVAPYEALKLRLLNASHLAIASLGTLYGYRSVVETMGNPMIRRFMVGLMSSELELTLPTIAGIDVAEYKSTLLDRFANPAIQDTVKRINVDAPINLLLDPIGDCLRRNYPINLLSLCVAAWCVRVQVEARGGHDGRPMGKAEAQLQQLAKCDADPSSYLAVRAVFGEQGKHPRLIEATRRWVQCLKRFGVASTVERAAESGAF